MRLLPIFLVLLLISLSFSVDITTCNALNASTVYRLTADLTNQARTCFNVTGNSIVLNLNGHIVDGNSGTTFAGLQNTVPVTGFTLANGTIQDFGYPVNLTDLNTTIITNMTISNSTVDSCLALRGTSNSAVFKDINISDSTIKDCAGTNANSDGITIINVGAASPTFSDIRINNLSIYAVTAGNGIRITRGTGNLTNTTIWFINQTSSASGGEGVRVTPTAGIWNITGVITNQTASNGIDWVAAAAGNLTGNRVNKTQSLGTCATNTCVGILINTATNGMTINNNNISNTGDQCISITGGTDNGFIRNNNCDNNTDQGIELASGITGFNISSNNVYNASIGIAIDTGANSNYLTLNTVSNSTSTGGISIQSNTNQLISNTVANSSTGDGIRLDAGDDNNLTGNLVNKTFLDGITSFSDADRNRVINNVVVNSSSDCITTASGADNSSYIGNNISNCAASGFHLTDTTTGDNNYTDNLEFNTTTFIDMNNAGTNRFFNHTLAYNVTAGWVNWTNFNISATVLIRNASNVYIMPDFVSVDIGALSFLNSSARVKIGIDNPCVLTTNYSLYEKSGFPVSKADIMQGGSSVGSVLCNNYVGYFNVTHFSGYAPYVIWLGGFSELPSSGSANVSTILYITFFDESTNTQISIDSASLSLSITPDANPGIGSTLIGYSGVGTVQNATVKAYPNFILANLSSVESYSKASYVTRSRFMVFADTNLSIQQNISLYLLPSADASYAIINVVRNGVPVQGAYITIQKFFASNATYTQIDQKISNSNGQAALFIDPIAYYKFIVYDVDGDQLFTSVGPEQFICDTQCHITINVGLLNPVNMVSPYPVSYCYGVNATNSIVFSYADATGLTSTINFLAHREGVAAPVYNNTIVGSSGGAVYALANPENLSNFLYSCEVWRTASPALQYTVNLIDFRIPGYITDWLLPALSIVTVIGAAVSLPIGVGLAGVSLFLLSAMGVVPISMDVSIPIMVVGLILAFLTSKRGSD